MQYLPQRRETKNSKRDVPIGIPLWDHSGYLYHTLYSSS